MLSNPNSWFHSNGASHYPRASSPLADPLMTRMHPQQHQQQLACQAEQRFVSNLLPNLTCGASGQLQKQKNGNNSPRGGYSGTTDAVVGSLAWTLKVQEDIEHFLSEITDIHRQLSSLIETYPFEPKQQQPQQALSPSPGKNRRLFFSNGETFINFHKQLDDFKFKCDHAVDSVQAKDTFGSLQDSMPPFSPMSEFEKSRRESAVQPWESTTDDEGNVANDFFANYKPEDGNVPLNVSSSQVSPNDSLPDLPEMLQDEVTTATSSPSSSVEIKDNDSSFLTTRVSLISEPEISTSSKEVFSSHSKDAIPKSTDTKAPVTFPLSPAINAAVAAFMPSLQTFITNVAVAAVAASFQAQNQSFGNILDLNQVNSMQQQYLTQDASNQANHHQASLHGPKPASAAPPAAVHHSVSSSTTPDDLEPKPRESASHQNDCPPVYSMPNFAFLPPVNAVYSRKVFLGGVPWDLNNDDLMSVFKPFGAVSIQRPGREVRLSRQTSQTVEKAGYLYLIFDADTSVNRLLNECIQEVSQCGFKYFYLLTSKAENSKKVQVIPWNVSDLTLIVNPEVVPDPKRTVYLGGLHGKMNAGAVARALGQVFGSIEYVSLATDKYQYPTGSGRAMFTFQKDAASAFRAGFIRIKSDCFEKTIKIDPFLVDSSCLICWAPKASVFCKDCYKGGRYYCEVCWNREHKDEPYKSHQILIKSFA